MCHMPSPATRELGAWSVLTGHKQNWGPPGKEEDEWKPGSSVCEQVCPLGQVVHRPKRRGRVLLVPVPPTVTDVEPGTRSAELDRFGGSPHSALREELLIRRQRSSPCPRGAPSQMGRHSPPRPTEATSTRTCALLDRTAACCARMGSEGTRGGPQEAAASPAPGPFGQSEGRPSSAVGGGDPSQSSSCQEQSLEFGSHPGGARGSKWQPNGV